MTTVEKLLVQIFERKNSFIEQVKQQTELYSQHRASKLLIDGITPPSWLWNPNTSPDLKELNKEELISKILRPYPQHPVHSSVGHYPLYSNLAVTGYNEEFPDGVFMESMAFDNALNRQDDPTVPTFNREDSPRVFISVPEPDTSITLPGDQADERILNIPTVPTFNREDHGPSILNSVPEPETSVTSPEDQEDERILNIPTVPALTREDHSPSVLNAVPVQETSVTSPENQADERILNIPTVPASNREDHSPSVLNSFPELHTSVTSPVDQADERILNIYSAPDQSVAGIKRSKSRQKALELRNSAKALTKSGLRYENTSNVFSSQIRFSLSATNQSGQKDELPKLEPCVTGNQICEDKELDEAQQGNDTNQGQGLVEPSVGLFCRATNSQSWSNDKETYETVPYSVIPSSGNIMSKSDCKETSAAIDEHTNPSFMVSELVLHDHVNQSRRCSSSDDKQRKELESQVPLTHSDSSVFVEPKQLSFNETEVCNLKAFTSNSGKRRLDNSLESMSSPLSIYAVSLDKGISGDVDQLLLGRQSPKKSDVSSRGEEANGGYSETELRKSDVSSKREEAHGEYSETDFPENPDNEAENVRPVTSNTMLKAFEETKEDRLDYEISEVNHEADSTLPKTVDVPDIPIPSVKLYKEHGLDSLPERHMEEGEWNDEANKGQLVSSAPESENVRPSDCHNSAKQPRAESCGFSIEKVDVSCSQHGDSPNEGLVPYSASRSNGEKNSLEKSVRQANMGSWPQPKRRKIEHQQTHSFTTSPSFRVRKPHSNQWDPASAYLENIELNTDTVLMDTFHVNKNANTEIHQEMNSYLTEGIESAILSQNEEVGFCYEEKNGCENHSSVIANKQLETVLVSSPIDESKNSQGYPSSSRVDASELGEGQCSPHLFNVEKNGENLNSENLILTNTMLERLQSPKLKGALETEHSLCSPSNEVMDGLIKESRNSQGHPSSNRIDARELGDGQCSPHLFHIEKNRENRNSENLSLTNTMLERLQTPKWKDALQMQHSPLSPTNEVTDCLIKESRNSQRYPSSSRIDARELGDGQCALETENSLLSPSNEVMDCLIKESRNSYRYPSSSCIDGRELGDGQCSPHLFNVEKNSESLNSENLSLTNTMLERLQSPKWRGASQTEHSLLSPSNEVMELIDVDESMPVLEGFIVDEQSDNDQLDYAVDGIDFDKLDLPRTTIERASILAEICRSASLDKSLSHFSSAFKFRETENLYHSVPNGHLEHLDLGGTFSLTSDVGEQQSRSSSGDDYKDTLEGMPYSDSIAYSAARYCWNPKSQYTSPVGKLWERLSSHTGSSEKRLSSNPELTCFPIEEDPCISEENGTADDNADDVQEEIDSSLAENCDNRQPLKDLTNLGLNPPISVSAQEETVGTDSVDYVSAKSSVRGTQDKVLWSPKNQYRNMRQNKEKQTSFIGATDGRKKQTSSICTNGIRKAKESINNSISKPPLLNKTSLQKQDRNLSLKPFRRNNIVSNVSSFIPLIQQKQEATVCAGKRDVKVKALEAAEAAKRLEEKKENERKMRKEAMKVERAKMEERNLRDMELEKKKKDAERKKKEADISSKKRLREEEERKEKEKKRMRVEARHRQREQPEKMRGEKAEKENQRSKDEQILSKREFHNESLTQQDKETTRGDNSVALKKTGTELVPTEVVMNYEECGTSGQSCEAGEAMHTVDNSPKKEDLIVQNSHGNSYEISPYQCSDDEDEEDDELPAKKYFPSWASKSSVAVLLPLQQEMDPDKIFPLQSFCSMDEALLPRKLQQKQMAA